jgi:hypothetical protein
MNNAIESLAVVVPTRNFAKGLPRFLAAWREQFRKHNITARFAVIDDGDEEPLTSTDLDVLIIRNDRPTGLGNCFNQGVKALDGQEPILILVPDFGYRPTDLSVFLDALKNVDMAVGVRPSLNPPTWVRRGQRMGSWLRRWLFGIPDMGTMPWYGWSAIRRRWSFRFCYGPRLQDHGVGIAMVHRSVWNRCPIQSTGGFALLELIAKANFLGATIAEISLSKPSDMPVMKGRFEFHAADERLVFRRPTFGKLIEPSTAAATSEENTPGETPGVA